MQIERGSPLKGFGSSFLKKSLTKNSFKKSWIFVSSLEKAWPKIYLKSIVFS
ncbi:MULTISPECIES: hypothetical protein [Methanosarcina]|uniref:hypothetical protein n=1 Tax=Methanosarcina TaxID=2207 RepID=UPI0012DFFB04|nr:MULTISPECIES: hypothetical protein [Methanosarcina]